MLGGGEYIYIEESQPTKVNQFAKLLSPLIQGPKCFRFFYRMLGRDVGGLDVLLQVRGQQGDYLMWRKSGDQGNQWIKASVDIGYTDECQVGRIFELDSSFSHEPSGYWLVTSLAFSQRLSVVTLFH